MQKRIFAVFFVGFILTARAVSGDLLQTIDRTRSVVITYDKELDKVVPFKEFRASIKGLEIMAEKYNGQCKNDMNKAIHLGYQATDDYFRATNTLFEWCVTGRTVFDYILKNHRSLGPGDVKFAITETIANGMKTLNESLGILDKVKSRLTEIHGLLQPMPDTLNNELNQLRLDYEKRIQELDELRDKLAGISLAIGFLATFALTIAFGPIGFAIGLGGTLSAAGISVGVIQSRKYDEEEKWKITEAYYLALIQTVRHATSNVTTVKEKLEIEITAITALRGNVGGYQEIARFFPNPLLDKLESLKDALEEFISRHGGGIEVPRVRRDLNDFGFNLERMIENDRYHLNLTRKEREIQFWKLKPLNENSIFLTHHIDKFVL